MINSPSLFQNSRLTEKDIRSLKKDNDDWFQICIYQILSEKFIKEFKNKIDWSCVSKYQKLSEKFIREFKDNVNWRYISEYQKLSEKFIREFKDNVDWFYISINQKLSEKFIREFKDNVNWLCVSEYQKLSEKFIKEFKDNVKLSCISRHQKLSKKFREEEKLQIPKYCWLYKTAKEKKDYIKKNTNYEIIGNSVIAYKTVRYNMYSVYNFQYKYEVGKEYESTADYNADDPYSFGLSAWTKKRALDYYNRGKLLKVEIKIKDIACIVRSENKIRATKIKILECE
jgi:hypothetical protein